MIMMSPIHPKDSLSSPQDFLKQRFVQFYTIVFSTTLTSSCSTLTKRVRFFWLHQKSLTYDLLFFTFYNQSDDRVCSPIKADGRLIYYRVGDEDGNVDERAKEELFCFKGMGLEELKQKLKEETGLTDISICSKNPLNGKLYPLRLHLPPNNAKMHVVLIPSSSKG